MYPQKTTAYNLESIVKLEQLQLTINLTFNLHNLNLNFDNPFLYLKTTTMKHGFPPKNKNSRVTKNCKSYTNRTIVRSVVNINKYDHSIL